MKTALNKEAIRQHLRAAVLGNEIIVLDEVNSTNDYAKQSVKRHGTVVLAEKQNAGKGRMGRTWESPRGRSILMSVVLRPGPHSPSLPLINLAAGLAVAQAIERHSALSPTVKWPNDVWIAGKKICGILAEGQYRGEALTALIIGIGCNVNQQPDEFPDRLRWPATSLAMEVGAPVDRNPLIAAILNALESWYDSIRAGEVHHMLAEWKTKCGHRNAPVRVIREAGEVNGIFRDVTPEGAAQIERPSGDMETIFSGDLTPLIAPEPKK